VRDAAHRWLDQSDDHARALRRGEESQGGAADAASVLHAAVARSAGDGWPARLTARWFDDVFGPGPRGLPIRIAALPRTLGASSFARGLVAFGRAVRDAATPRSLPFAVARDPWHAEEHRLGHAFGALAADPEFYVRSLGTGRRTAAAQARTVAATALLESRLQAARVLLGDDAAFAPADAFDELTARVFGAQLDRRLRGAWPASRDDDPERFTALFAAQALRETLRDRFDVDWFRNPRAWEYLRGDAIAVALATDVDATAGDAGGATRAAEGATRATRGGAGATPVAEAIAATAATAGPPLRAEIEAFARAFEGAIGREPLGQRPALRSSSPARACTRSLRRRAPPSLRRPRCTHSRARPRP
jgi:hypothetical protein